ncbi:hypothetical protein NHH03_20675 [Stieleria sp. TO1_6]|uniref:hypothetical protein n=1 Tax=Stieleria tagensis TaxID=2956795 RepID=UPI00209B9B23|nr:hypothetical protein [Stieleria tagensis]MCO8124171.1 hypothetical protein [Stieleria tagensis]
MNALSANTPCDVLRDGTERLGPPLSQQQGDQEYQVIYGFSGKGPYDRFAAQCDRPLMPYPLVKGYLKNRIAESAEVIHLVVVDASGPQEAQLSAVTMEAVLEAVQKNAPHVTLSFQLTLDRSSQTYRVDPISSGFQVTSRPAETQPS